MTDAGRVEPDQLERAAADIGQHAVGAGNAALQAGRRQPASSAPGQDADLGARHALLQGGDELRAVAGVAHRRRCQHLERVGAASHGRSTW